MSGQPSAGGARWTKSRRGKNRQRKVCSARETFAVARELRRYEPAAESEPQGHRGARTQCGNARDAFTMKTYFFFTANCFAVIENCKNRNVELRVMWE